MIVDAHAHAFLSALEDPERTVDEIGPADRRAPIEDLLATMGIAGVDRAVVLPLGPEDAYVARVLREHPQTVRGIAVDDPDEPDVDAVLDRLRRGGFAGLRMFALPESQRERWQALAAGLAAADLVLWMYPRPEDVGHIDALAGAHPDLRIALNHSGLTQAGIGVDANGRPRVDSSLPQPSLPAVAALARHERIVVILSGAYGFSHRPYPYPDIGAHVTVIAEAFGTARLMWASDFPWAVDDPGYPALLDLVDHHLPGLSADERTDVLGATCLRFLDWED